VGPGYNSYCRVRRRFTVLVEAMLGCCGKARDSFFLVGRWGAVSALRGSCCRYGVRAPFGELMARLLTVPISVGGGFKDVQDRRRSDGWGR